MKGNRHEPESGSSNHQILGLPTDYADATDFFLIDQVRRFRCCPSHPKNLTTSPCWVMGEGCTDSLPSRLLEGIPGKLEISCYLCPDFSSKLGLLLRARIASITCSDGALEIDTALKLEKRSSDRAVGHLLR